MILWSSLIASCFSKCLLHLYAEFTRSGALKNRAAVACQLLIFVAQRSQETKLINSVVTIESSQSFWLYLAKFVRVLLRRKSMEIWYSKTTHHSRIVEVAASPWPKRNAQNIFCFVNPRIADLSKVSTEKNPQDIKARYGWLTPEKSEILS